MKEKDDHWSLHFLRWFCPEQLYEEIEGDLIQKFDKEVKNLARKERGED
jgi:ferritin